MIGTSAAARLPAILAPRMVGPLASRAPSPLLCLTEGYRVNGQRHALKRSCRRVAVFMIITVLGARARQEARLGCRCLHAGRSVARSVVRSVSFVAIGRRLVQPVPRFLVGVVFRVEERVEPRLDCSLQALLHLPDV